MPANILGVGGFFTSPPPPSGGGTTREIFYTGVDLNSSIGDFRARTVGSGNGHNFTFPVPGDFQSVISLDLMALPGVTNIAADIDLFSDYGADGEAFNNHSESDLGITYNIVMNQLASLDIASVFSAIAAGDRCGIRIDHNGIGGNIHYLGIRLFYNI